MEDKKIPPLTLGELENRKIIRRKTKDLIRRKILVKKPCQLCGKKRNIDCHHRNYKTPTNILWLCRICHIGCHNRNRFISENPDLAKIYKIKHERINNKRVCLERW